MSAGQVKIEETSFGRLTCGGDKQEVKRYVLKNSLDCEVTLISYGAAIQSIKVKDKSNKLVSVVLGFDKLEDYTDSTLNPYFGSTVGRVTNRISNGEFKLNGQTYKLEKNNGNHCLHSGKEGIAKKNWASTVVDNGVKFNYVSADGEAGFPGEVWFETIYQLDGAENTLRIETKAITDKETPVNVTNHTYFNLAGEDTPDKIYDQEVKLYCDKYLDFNRDDVTVTGKINPVEGGKYDFREFQKLAQRIKADGHWPDEGYDNFFLLTDDKSELRDVASVRNVANGLRLDVKSNQNGVQFYTGNHLNVKRNDRPTGGYSIHHGFCLEAHNYPDSVNQATFPSCILSPDQEYIHKTVFSFKIDN